MKRLVTAAIALLPIAVQAGEILYIEATPIRAVTGAAPESLRDILSRLPAKDAAATTDPRDPTCPVTSAHEGSHFIASRMSRPSHRAFYFLDGDCWLVPVTKNTRLSRVAIAVPLHKRGPVYQTYMVDAGRDWEAIPLVLFDEALAYQNGSIARAEAGIKQRGETLRHAAELLLYCHYLVKAIEDQEDEDYPKEDVREFFQFLLTRARIIGGNEWKEDDVLREVPSL